MNRTLDSSFQDTGLNHNQKRRLEDRDRRLRQLEAEVRDLRKLVWKLQKDQARMLGFLEGRGVMGKAPPEPERAS